MSFKVKIFGRILAERLVSVDAKFSNARRGLPVSRTMFPRRAMRLGGCGILYQKFVRAGSSFRGSQKIGEKGGVERKLALALVRSFFALSIGDNIRYFSQSSLGNYHWLRTRRLLRLQKTNSSLAPLPLRFAAKCEARRSLRREKPPRPYDGVSGRDERLSRLGACRKCKARSRTAQRTPKSPV